MTLNKSKIFILSFFLCIAILFCYRYFFLLPRIKKEGRYTIGQVNEFHIKKGGAYNVYFTYIIKGKEYENYSNASYESVKNLKSGDRFLVIFAEQNYFLESPGIILDNPVPDNISVAPPDGWKNKPSWAK
ncbi:hypothetical protein [Flavobacterium columnare]|uniref:Uncharacterized protein n=1 Tax=Flavobacterium columnare TaxID=996 RepID=A0AA94JNS7_9FLAO|nr:hypothetical protein [Flavobacterium columnare]MCH4828264.1 hypothetical protein [Flavobacterium columnare]MCH4834262.1 hypothetical protein [Flavobacterium columnare]